MLVVALFHGNLFTLVVGESMNPEGMLVLMKWDGETPYIFFFKHGLDEEKCVSIVSMVRTESRKALNFIGPN